MESKGLENKNRDPPAKNRAKEGLLKKKYRALFSKDGGNQVAGQMNCKQHYYFLQEVVYIPSRLYFNVFFLYSFFSYPFFIADNLVIYCKRTASGGCKQLLQLNRGNPVNVHGCVLLVFFRKLLCIYYLPITGIYILNTLCVSNVTCITILYKKSLSILVKLYEFLVIFQKLLSKETIKDC